MSNKRGSIRLRYYFCPQCERRIDPNEIESAVILRLNQELGRHITVERIVKRISQMRPTITVRIKELDNEVITRRYQLNQLDGGYYNAVWDTETIQTLRTLALERISELEDLKRLSIQTENKLNELVHNPNVMSRMVARAQKLSDALPMHELRFLLLNMVEEISIHVGRTGGLTIESITYRTLPLPYLEESFNQISSL